MTATTAQAPTGRAFKAAVMALAEHLPPGWSARTDDDGRWGRVEGILTGPDGMEISIIENDRPDSWIALGQYPRSRPTGRNSPRSITQTYTRSPKTLGADLTRRLPAPYAEAFARMAALDAAADAQDAHRAAFVNQVAESLPGTTIHDHARGYGRPEYRAHWQGGYDADTWSARPSLHLEQWVDRWKIELNGLPEELVMQIVDVLRAHQNHAGTPPTS